MSQKTFYNYSVAIRKSKVILKLNKPTYIGISILNLSKALVYELHYDDVRNKYGNNSRLLFTGADILM